MKRSAILAIVLLVAAFASFLAWNAVRQEREFQRLIAVGDASLAQDQTFVAIEAFSGALALKPDSMLAYLKRGDTYRRRGELGAALRDLRRAAEMDPTATRPLELLGDVNVAMGRYEQAADHYRALIALDDGSPHVFYKLALAHYRAGQPAAAIDPLEHAVALDQRFVEAHHLLGLCLREQERPREALGALTRAIQINPAFVAARAELASLYTSLGRNREGIEQLEALAAIEPSRAERLVSVGLTYARLGRTDAAILTLGRAAERFPEEPVVYTALGRVWLDTAELRDDPVALRKALEALQPAAARENAASETLALYGRALFLSGDVAAAERVLRQATTRFPVAPQAFRYLSAAAERLGHVAAARDALVDYASLVEDEQTRALAAKIAEMSLRVDDAAAALTWAQRAVDGGAADSSSLVLLADAQWRGGQREAALETVRGALARDPRNRALLRLQRRFTAVRSLPDPARREARLPGN